MPQLLLELFSEEIPARMQTQAAKDLARMAGERLKAAGLPHESLNTYAGPRRLTLVVEGLPAAPYPALPRLTGTTPRFDDTPSGWRSGPSPIWPSGRTPASSWSRSSRWSMTGSTWSCSGGAPEDAVSVRRA